VLSELNGSCKETPPAPSMPIIALIERPTTRSEYYNSNPASTDGILKKAQLSLEFLLKSIGWKEKHMENALFPKVPILSF
jgi:hypothetical protein